MHPYAKRGNALNKTNRASIPITGSVVRSSCGIDHRSSPLRVKGVLKVLTGLAVPTGMTIIKYVFWGMCIAITAVSYGCDFCRSFLLQYLLTIWYDFFG